MVGDDENRTKKILPSRFARSFGIGCFHFGTEKIENLDIDQFAKKLERYLGKIPNIEAVSVEPIRYTKGRENFSYLDSDGDLTGGSGIFPWPTRWEIKFGLTISSITQEDVAPLVGPIEGTNFSVRVRYENGFPVTFIEATDITLERPSDAVVIVRKYLEKYAPKNDYIKFHSLGPSPFHADFFVSFETTDDVIDMVVFKQPGYDRIIVKASKNLDKAKQSEFVSEIQKYIASELGVFYDAVQTNNRMRVSWHKITASISNLTDDTPGLKAKIIRLASRTFAMSTGRASLALAAFKLKLNERVDHLTSELFDDKSIRIDELHSYTEAEIEELRSLPIEDYASVLDILNKRKSAWTTNFIVLIAAIIGFLGGVAGGIVQAKMTTSSPPKSQSPS